MLATLKLFSQYIFNKMFDRNPWEDIKEYPAPPHFREQIKNFVARLLNQPKKTKK
jgi:hypothetical protein